MARFKKGWNATVDVDGEAVELSFRNPSNQELSEFLASRWEPGKKGRVKDQSHEARCEFFDLLITGVKNLEDEEGNPVTPERKDVIPSNWKSDIVFKKFENSDIEIKN